MEPWHIWAIAGIICVILEMVSPAFFFGSFSAAALVTAAAAALGSSFNWQLATFAVATVVSLMAIRPVFLYHFYRSGDSRPVNADALVGQTAVVVDAIGEDGAGRVKVGAEEWRAVSESGAPVEAGTRVEITAVSSATLTVRPKVPAAESGNLTSV
jgi:membrane protein implicated in regulation of membrane protease activity